MRHSIVYGAICALAVVIGAIPAKAATFDCGLDISVDVLGASSFSSFNCGAATVGNVTTITLTEQWNSTAPVFLEFFIPNADDPDRQDDIFYSPGTIFEVKKIITNMTNVLFNNFSNELGHGGAGNDFVPSDEDDGLSFAQDPGTTSGFKDGFEPTRDAGIFANFEADQFADRDFLNFFNNTAAAGLAPNETTTITFGMRDFDHDVGTNTVGDSFILAQTPNFEPPPPPPPPIPEPGTLLIFGLGLAGIGALRRRKFV